MGNLGLKFVGHDELLYCIMRYGHDQVFQFETKKQERSCISIGICKSSKLDICALQFQFRSWSMQPEYINNIRSCKPAHFVLGAIARYTVYIYGVLRLDFS